jgi:hypothetical protein
LALYKKPQAPSPFHTAPWRPSTPPPHHRRSTAAGVLPAPGSAPPAPFPPFQAPR